MILELTGSRILSPYFGNSIYVWTGLIGIILGFLSLGYYFGGNLADKSASPKILSTLFFYASIFTFFIALIKEPILNLISQLTSGDLRAGSALSIIILFGPISFLLGSITPIIVKLKLNNFKSLGQDAGKIYTLSTLGSIFGTFLSGYLLIPSIGNTLTVYITALSLALTSLWINPTLTNFQKKLLFFALILFLLNTKYKFLKIKALADIDTTYNRVIIRQYEVQNKKIRTLSTDNSGIQSSIDLNNPNILITDYLIEFANVTQKIKKPQNALLIGGAGFIFPRYFITNNLGENIDVIEIDPKMADIAKKYFFLTQSEKIKIITDDARNYPKYTNKKYELIYLDAFNSIVPPYHLTTKEYLKSLSNLLTPDGAVVINLISATTGNNSQFLIWQTSTLKTIFPYVSLYKIEVNKAATKSQNILLLATNNQEAISKIDLDPHFVKTKLDLNHYLKKDNILTDDFAPVEHLTASLIFN